MQHRFFTTWQNIFIIFLFLISCSQSDNQSEGSTTTAEEKRTEVHSPAVEAEEHTGQKSETILTPSATDIPMDTILGSWIRPDGNYVLEFTGINEDRTLQANYYNPQPINVSLAQVKKEDRLKVYVEFDDVNYRGSYYDLHFDPVNDALTGNYYQAAYGQTYSIAFVRYKAEN
jgi:hypothetical protein